MISFNHSHLRIITIGGDFKPGKTIKFNCKDLSINIDFAVFDKRILILTKEGTLSLIELKNLKRFQELKTIKVEGITNRVEEAKTVSVCNRGKFFMVNLKFLNSYRSSSLIVYEIFKERFIRKGEFDVGFLEQKMFNCLRFVRYTGNLLYFCALPFDEGRIPLLTFCYDQDSNEIEEVLELRRMISVSQVYKFSEIRNGEFSGITKNSRVLSIKYN